MPTKDKSGVYAIEQVDAKRYYIGSSKWIYKRWQQHRKLLRVGRHHSMRLQNAWTKYGEDAFRFFILEECSIEQLLIKEQEYLNNLDPEFNNCKIAGSREGSKHSPESLAKVIAATRARAAARTHCPHGHEYTIENSYFNKKNEKICRACNRERVSRIYAKETPEQRNTRLARMLEYTRRRRGKI